MKLRAWLLWKTPIMNGYSFSDKVRFLLFNQVPTFADLSMARRYGR